MSRFIDLTAEITGQAFSYNAQDLSNITVTLRVPGGLTRDNLPQLLDHVLASRGFTTIRTPGSPVLSVVKLEQAAGLSGVAAAEQMPSVLGAGFVTELVEVRHQSPKNLVDALKPFIGKQGASVAAIGESRLLAVSDLASRMPEIKAMIARLDVRDEIATSEISLMHVPAAEAISLLTDLAKKREAAGGVKLAGDLVAASGGGSVILICRPGDEAVWRDLIRTVDKREPVETRTYTPRLIAAKDLSSLVEKIGHTPGSGAGVVDERFRVVVDESTGTLIVTAAPAQHEKIAAVLAQFDSADQTPTPVRSFVVKNRPVIEVLSTLQQLISSGALGTNAQAAERALVSEGASQSSYRTPFPPPTASPLLVGPLNRVPLSAAAGGITGGDTSVGTQGSAAGPRGVGGGVSLTADEATNAIIAIGEARLLDQIAELLKTIDVRQPQVMLEVMLVSLSDTEALSLGVEIEKIGNLGNATTVLSSIFGLSSGSAGNRVPNNAAGFTGAVLNAGEFNLIVHALQSINKGNALSNPRLLVTNNQRAVFSSTLQQPITQQTRTGSNDTTFSYGGSESAGTTISVQPQIAQGDHLVLTYSIKLSNFIGTSTTAGLPPPKQENSVDSMATIPDGYTVVVGGMETITNSEAIAQVPILGDIPVIGELFKTRDIGNGRTRFYVFIRANVLRSNMLEDLKYISAGDIQSANNAGVRGEVNDGFPEVRARVIR